MKPTPPTSVQGLSFDELVARAKSSEPELNPTELDSMVQRFEARLKLEGALPVQTPAGNPAAAARHAGRLSATGKAVLGGASVAAVAAFIYGATFGTSRQAAEFAAPHTDEAPRVEQPLPSADSAFTNRGSAVEHPDVVPAPADKNEALAPNDARQLSGGKARRTPAPSRHDGARASEPTSAVPAVTPKPAVQQSTTDAPIVEPATTEPAAVKSPPALDASLAQLERAERELRSGNPSAALSTLALPVVASLSSRAEALRAVALCQGGQVAAGRRLATQHLVRNPRSPYEQRLQRACGDI